MAATTTTTMTYASFPHPPTNFAAALDDAMGPLSPTSSVSVDESTPFKGTGIEEQAMGGLREMIAAAAAGGGADGGIGIGGHFLLSPSSPVKERSRRATMPDGFKPKTHEVLIPSTRASAFPPYSISFLSNLPMCGDQLILFTISLQNS
jgi:hypothetical protein